MNDELGELLADMTDADRVTVNAAWFRRLRNAEKAIERVRELAFDRMSHSGGNAEEIWSSEILDIVGDGM